MTDINLLIYTMALYKNKKILINNLNKYLIEHSFSFL